MNNRETRALTGAACELRAEGEGGTIVGYAAVYNQLSEDLGGFRERILPGAFKRALGGEADVRALINHDEALVLGRTKSGTLRLRSTAKGLAVQIDPPQTGYARDLRESMSRGDVDGMSFAFGKAKDEWGEEQIDGKPVTVRTVRDVDIYDVSVVTYPAYPQTEVALRSLQTARRGKRDRRQDEAPPETPAADELTLEALAARLAALEAWQAEVKADGEDDEEGEGLTEEEMSMAQKQAEAEAAEA